MKLTHVIVDAAVVVAHRPLTVETFPRTLAAAAEAIARGDLEEREGGWIVMPSTEQLLGALEVPVIGRVGPGDATAIDASPFLRERTEVTKSLREIAEAAQDALIVTGHREYRRVPHGERWRWLLVPPFGFDPRYAEMVTRRLERIHR